VPLLRDSFGALQVCGPGDGKTCLPGGLVAVITPRHLASISEVLLKKHTKLVSLFAAVAGAASLLVSPAFGQEAPGNFIHVSNHALWTHSVTITEWNIDSAGNSIAGEKNVWTGSPGDSWYWPIGKTVSYITLQEGDRSPFKIIGLPACYRISSSGDMHPADGSCTSDGHRVVWNG
jgi:hypothetical protein